jgi:hypothetical protein
MAEVDLQKIIDERAKISYRHFPEAEYLPTGQRLWKHIEFNKRGRDKMSTTSAVICGLARDVAHILPATIARIEKLGEMFDSYQVVIYENDSVDATRDILDKWQMVRDNVECLYENRDDPANMQVRDLDRASRMSYYRNAMRKYVITNHGFHPYCIVVDTDLPGGWSFEGVANTFGQSNWDMVGSNGLLNDHPAVAQLGHPLYFDVWALRLNDYTPIPGHEGNIMHWDYGDPMVPVKSCFGGLGIYNMEAMRRCSYSGVDCEHVPFHRQMAQQGLGRIFLNPSQIVLY